MKMNMEMLTKILELAITLIGIIVTTYVIPYIKSKYTQNELDKLTEYIEYGVRCAEMYFDTTDGKAKKQYVLNYVMGVLDNLVDVELTEGELDTLIEGVVQSVKYSFSDLVK